MTANCGKSFEPRVVCTRWRLMVAGSAAALFLSIVRPIIALVIRAELPTFRLFASRLCRKDRAGSGGRLFIIQSAAALRGEPKSAIEVFHRSFDDPQTTVGWEAAAGCTILSAAAPFAVLFAALPSSMFMLRTRR